MQHLTSDVLNKLKGKLEADKARINARLTELKTQDPFADPDRTNDNASSDTDANEESVHDRVAAVVAELKHELDLIEEALGKMNDGKYGLCDVCGNPIPVDRLMALPTASVCMGEHA